MKRHSGRSLCERAKQGGDGGGHQRFGRRLLSSTHQFPLAASCRGLETGVRDKLIERSRSPSSNSAWFMTVPTPGVLTFYYRLGASETAEPRHRRFYAIIPPAESGSPLLRTPTLPRTPLQNEVRDAVPGTVSLLLTPPGDGQCREVGVTVCICLSPAKIEPLCGQSKFYFRRIFRTSALLL